MSKKQPKLTPWFPANVEPAYIGVYLKEFGGSITDYQYWDGSRWHYGHDTPDKTIKKLKQNPTSWVPNARRWRGLAVKP